MLIPIVIPARNEEKKLAATIDSINKMAAYANIDALKIVVNDGSKDQTAAIAKNAGCIVIDLPDRGYSALAKPELANTHNAGFEYINNNVADYKYLIVIGADSSFEENYLSILLHHMEKNINLVMASGIIDNLHTAENAVRGTGRIIRKTFWMEMNGKLPTNFYSWESYPIIYALSKGYETRTIYEAIMHTSRNPLENTDWKRYGIGMKEQGCIFPYVLLRAAKGILSGQVKNSFRLISGFLFSKPNLYPVQQRKYVSDYQKKRIMNYISGAK